MLSEIEIISSTLSENRLNDFSADVYISAYYFGTRHNFLIKVTAPWNPMALSADSILIENHMLYMVNSAMALDLSYEEENSLKKTLLYYYKTKIRV